MGHAHDFADAELERTAEKHADDVLADHEKLMQFLRDYEPALDQLCRAFKNLPFAEQELSRLNPDTTPALGGLVIALSNLESDLWKRARQDYLEA